MVRAAFAALVALTPLFALAANNWNKPCFDGECSYDLRTNGKVTATLKISGSPNAISDITPAAGWAILGCDADASEQDIRIVCQDPGSKCAHLFRNAGPTGKLVRLPDNCGRSAFARIANDWIHRDQTVPGHIRNRFQRRGMDVPTVHGVQLDTDFAAIDPAQTGEVTMIVIGSTAPIDTDARIGQQAPDHIVEAALQGFSKSFDKSKTTDLTLVDANNHFSIFSKSFSCPGQPISAGSIDISADASLHVAMQIGVVAKGTIIPPKVKEFALFTGLDAELNAKLHMAASVSGTLDSGEIPLYEIGLPSIDFKDILSVGSSFKILGQATATLTLAMDLTVGLTYHAKSAKLFWPAPKSEPSGGNFSPGDVPLKLYMAESVTASGTVAVHVIPRVDMHIEAFKVAKAQVFLDIDASVSMPFNVNLLRENGKPASHSHSERSSLSLALPPPPPPSLASSRIFPRHDHGARSTSVELREYEEEYEEEEKEKRSVASASNVNGCFKVLGGLDVHAGASASFFGLFDKSTKVTLFSKQFNIYQKCFGGATGRSRRDEIIEANGISIEKRDLSCLASGLSDLLGIADDNVPAGSIAPA